MNFLSRAWKALRLHWCLSDGTPEERDHLRAVQFANWRRPRIFQELVLVVIAILVIGPSTSVLPIEAGCLWVLAVAFNPLSRFWLPTWAARLGHLDRIGLRWLCLQAAVSGVLMAGPMVWIFLRTTSPALQIYVVIAAAGVLSAEASTYNLLPPVLAAWSCCFFGTAWVAGLALPWVMTLGFWVGIVVSCGSLIRSSLEASANVVRRCVVEFDLARQHRHLNLLLDDFGQASQDWLWECDRDLRLTYVSTGMSGALGRSEAELVGCSLSEVLVCAGVVGTDLTGLLSRLGGDRPFRNQSLALHPGGQARWVKVHARPKDEALLRGGWHGVATDVTAHVLHEQELERLAATDALTGLLGRRGFLQHVERSGGVAGRVGPGSVVLLDLDGFKSVNDLHGHVMGDRLLCEVGQRLQAHGGAGAPSLSRLGGDEFALWWPGERTLDEVRAYADMLREALRSSFVLGPLRLDVRASVGTARCPQDGESVEHLLRAADIALYVAKQLGRDRGVGYDAAMGEQAQHRAALTQDLARALDEGGLDVHYQPLIDAGDRRLVGAEALLRWRHPRLGPISPEVFIELAESSGLIVPIGAQVLHTACRDAQGWDGDCGVSVNVSARQFEHPFLVDQVARALSESGLPAFRLTLEVTESALVAKASAGATLDALRSLGVRLVLDDFGTGYSSLAYLQSLPFDGIKIDRTFVEELDGKGGGGIPPVLRAIVDMARGLGLPCTAEGVTTDAQARILRLLGCRTLQGYLVSPPVPADELSRRFRTGPAEPVAQAAAVG